MLRMRTNDIRPLRLQDSNRQHVQVTIAFIKHIKYLYSGGSGTQWCLCFVLLFGNNSGHFVDDFSSIFDKNLAVFGEPVDGHVLCMLDVMAGALIAPF